MKSILLFVVVVSSTLVSYSQGRLTLGDLVFNDTLDNSNTTEHIYEFELEKSIMSKSLGDFMEIKALKYRGRTIIAEASIDGKMVGVFSNQKNRKDYLFEQFFTMDEEKELFKSIVLSAESLTVEEHSNRNNSAKELISLFNYYGDASTNRQLRLLPIEGYSSKLILEKLFLDNFESTVYKFKDWDNRALWDNVYLVDPGTLIEDPTTLNITLPLEQSRAYALLQILFWPEFFGIHLNEEMLEPELVSSDSKIKPMLNDEEIFNFTEIETKPIGENFEFPELARQTGIQAGPYIPNAFSPNGDSINDLWIPVIHSSNPQAIETKIYDSYGNKVFEYIGATISWDGTNPNGANCNAGTYIVQCSYTDLSGNSVQSVTYLTLIR